MDFEALAVELMRQIFRLQRARPQKRLHESMQGELFMLHCIAHQEGDVLPSEISQVMDVSTARVAAVLNKLEGKGLITRQTDLRDRRRVLVSLTPRGLEVSSAHERAILLDMAAALETMGQQDALEYIRITARLAEIMLERHPPK